MSNTLDIGCGNNPYPGATLMDIRALPHVNLLSNIINIRVPSNTYSFVQCRNVLQYITYNEAEKALREIFRVLDTNGKARIIVPHIDYYINMYNHGIYKFEGDYSNFNEVCSGHQKHSYDAVKSTFLNFEHLESFVKKIIPDAKIIDINDRAYKKWEDEKVIQIVISKERF